MVNTMGSSASKVITLSDQELASIKSSTDFNEDIIRHWHKKFHADYPGGVIQLQLMIKLFSKLFLNGDARKFATRVFRFYDQNGSGDIDFQEFMSALAIFSPSSTEEKLNWIFNLYDLDTDGKLSMADISDMYSAMYHLTGEYDRSKAEESSQQLYSHVNKSCEEDLTVAEFVAGASKSAIIVQTLQRKHCMQDRHVDN